ncbi:dihydromonapterin reductase [Thiomicrorhabdus cannonii]|uniref:dihydromonapterin reductase n=1 Tax=Thiomicrorhabdus cannonii TaxID=2748011 RepID=UPI0015C0C07B|nr:dihydromonapterin reductase [Thiomicrorhabdus cannonii]
MLNDAILITGAGQRIGFYLAKRFLAEGQPVVFTYRTPRPQVESLIRLGAVGIRVDFNEDDAIERCVQRLYEQAGSLRAVIHNASIWLTDEQVAAQPTAFAELMRLHVEVPYRLNDALQPLLLASNSALKDIVTLSDASTAQANDRYMAYLASKAAMQNMSRNFAKKYAPHIKVNDIAPGLILFNEGDSEAYKQQRLQQSALGIEPGEAVVWQAVQYLLQSPYTTGISLPLEGGKAL